MSSSKTKTTQPNSELSPEELKLLEEYRSGRLGTPSEKVLSAEDLGVLNAVDNQVRDLLNELGLLEEQKFYILTALKESRAQKNALLQDVMLKYGIAANQPFKINRDSGVVELG